MQRKCLSWNAASPRVEFAGSLARSANSGQLFITGTVQQHVSGRWQADKGGGLGTIKLGIGPGQWKSASPPLNSFVKPCETLQWPRVVRSQMLGFDLIQKAPIAPGHQAVALAGWAWLREEHPSTGSDVVQWSKIALGSVCRCAGVQTHFSFGWKKIHWSLDLNGETSLFSIIGHVHTKERGYEFCKAVSLLYTSACVTCASLISAIITISPFQFCAGTIGGHLLGLRERPGIPISNTLRSETPLWVNPWCAECPETYHGGQYSALLLLNLKNCKGRGLKLVLAGIRTAEVWKAISKKMPGNKLQSVSRLDKAPSFCWRHFGGK